MRVVILESAEQVAEFGATFFVNQIVNKSNSVLGLATGSTPVSLYEKLIEKNNSGAISFKDVTTFNLDEYYGLSGDHPQSYRFFMQQKLFDHIDVAPESTHVPSGDCADPHQACKEYEQEIQRYGGIDLQLLRIGRNGHIGFNEPSSSIGSRTRVKSLTYETVRDNARFFGENETQPTLSLTMGIGTILEARKILLMATGESKADAIAYAVEGAISASCPASSLQLHPDTTIVVDKAASTELSDVEFYLDVEEKRLALEQQLIVNSAAA